MALRRESDENDTEVLDLRTGRMERPRAQRPFLNCGQSRSGQRDKELMGMC